MDDSEVALSVLRVWTVPSSGQVAAMLGVAVGGGAGVAVGGGGAVGDGVPQAVQTATINSAARVSLTVRLQVKSGSWVTLFPLVFYSL